MSAAVIAKAMSERELDEGIRAIVKDLGLLRYHTFDARKSGLGFPDLVIAGQDGVLFRELKREDGRVTAQQQEWLDTLTAADADAAVWRPAHLLSGQIARELAAISGLHITEVRHA